MKLSKNQKAILRLIIAAQTASDAAKVWRNPEIDPPRFPRDTHYWERRYRCKTDVIGRAIKEINGSHPMGINYWVEIRPDQNGFPSVVVLFDVKVDGIRRQISFHTPYGKAQKLLPYVGKGRPTRWNGIIGGSRDDAKALAALIYPECK